MKIIVEYDPVTEVVTFDDGLTFYGLSKSNVTEYKVSDTNITQLASLGYSADDLVKLKTQGII